LVLLPLTLLVLATVACGGRGGFGGPNEGAFTRGSFTDVHGTRDYQLYVPSGYEEQGGVPRGRWKLKEGRRISQKVERLNHYVIELLDRGHYNEAMPLATQAYAVARQSMLADDPAMANSLQGNE
jgi:hypothetical protein